MRIIKENTCAIVIDIQEKLIPVMTNSDELLKNNSILIEGLNTLSIPLITSVQYKKGLGDTVEELKTILGERPCFEKSSFSCCDDASITEALKDMDKKFVIVSGIESHICVQQTVLDLLENGFMPVLIENCVSSRREHDKIIAVERMRQAGAIVTTYEALLFELCRYSTASEFRTISKLIK